jgi:hypothetical protein
MAVSRISAAAKCQNLAYASQNQDVRDRASAKARKIRQRLGDDGCFDDPFPREA